MPVLLKNLNLLIANDLCRTEISFIVATLHGILWRKSFEKARITHL